MKSTIMFFLSNVQHYRFFFDFVLSKLPPKRMLYGMKGIEIDFVSNCDEVETSSIRS